MRAMRDTLAQRIYVTHGSDAGAMARRLLEAIQPAADWDRCAAVGIKPNLVVAKSYQSGATTNPAICEAVIMYLKDAGFTDICIIESAWVGAKTQDAFRVCGYTELAKKYGVPLVDVKKDGVVRCEYGGMRIDISQRALALDHIINLPLIKGHCQTRMTCALKNMKGLISDREKRRFHTMGLHKPIAYLNRMIAPSLTIADGTMTDPTFEEGGSPVCLNVMAAGTDSVLIDAYAADVLGLDVRDVEYIGIAEEIGVGSADLAQANVICIGEGAAAPVRTRADVLSAAAACIDARDACSACYANLVHALLALDAQDIKVCVGQGFRGKAGDIGSGNCTSGFRHSISGCPPRAEDIIEGLTGLRRQT